MPIGWLWDTKQLLQQQMHAGRPEQVPAPHHVGNALQGVVDHNGQMIARGRLLARQDDVAPGLRLCGDDAALATWALAKFFPAQSPSACARRRHVEPKRVRRYLARSTVGAGPAAAILRRPDRAAPRRDRAARARRLRAARPDGRFPRGSRSSDRSGLSLPVPRPPPDSAQNAPIAVAPAFPRISRATRGLHRSPPRIPAGTWWRRCPRSAAGIAPGAARQVEIQQRRIGMAEMEVAVRAGSKSENGWHDPPNTSHCRLDRQSIVQEPFTI